MRTIDHYEYAKQMVRGLRLSPMQKMCFRIGCVLPDFNKFTYMGHHVRDWAQGHSFKVRRRDILSFFSKPYTGSWLWWLRAGIRIHYLADSFSRPHNPEFRYGSKEHVAYEWKLHDHMQGIIFGKHFRPAKVDENFARWLQERHHRYMKETKGILDDARYIDSTLLGVWNWVCARILPPSVTKK